MKKFIALILIVVCALACGAVAFGEKIAIDDDGAPACGDLNLDGKVNDADAIVLNNFVTGKITELNQYCDFNDDGSVDSADAEYLLMSTFFPESYTLPEKALDFPE